MMLAKKCGWLEDLQGYEAQMSEQSRASLQAFLRG